MKPDLEVVDVAQHESFKVWGHGYPFRTVRWHFHPEFEIQLITETSGQYFVGDFVGHVGIITAGLVISPHRIAVFKESQRRICPAPLLPVLRTMSNAAPLTISAIASASFDSFAHASLNGMQCPYSRRKRGISSSSAKDSRSSHIFHIPLLPGGRTLPGVFCRARAHLRVAHGFVGINHAQHRISAKQRSQQ